MQSSIPQLYLKKKLEHRRFPKNFAEFSRTPPGDCLVFRYFKSDFSLCIFSVGFFNKTLMRYSETYLPCQWQKNKNENILDQEMILVDNLDPNTSFCNKRKEKIFQNCSGETILLNCRVNICSAKTFLKLSEETTSTENFTNFTGKHLCWRLPLINPEGLFILSLIFKTLTA